MPIPDNQKSFSPRVVLRPNAPSEEPDHFDPLSPPSPEKSVAFGLENINRTGGIMTLNEIKEPLGEVFQPLFAPTVLRHDGKGDVHLASFETYYTRDHFAIVVRRNLMAVDNLVNGAQVTISYAAFDNPYEPAVGTFSGTNTERFKLSSWYTISLAAPPRRRARRPAPSP